HAGMLLRDLLGVADVRLAHLQEPSTAWEQLERRVDELAGQRVEDDIHALPGGLLQEALAELNRARGGDVLVVQPERTQMSPLAGTGGREHLGTEMSCDLDGCRAHPAGSR